MKTVLEKVGKNKPYQQKAPKSCPVGGVDRDDGGPPAGSLKDRIATQADTTALQLQERDTLTDVT